MIISKTCSVTRASTVNRLAPKCIGTVARPSTAIGVQLAPDSLCGVGSNCKLAVIVTGTSDTSEPVSKRH
jgi:hypothetical protein